MQTLQHIEELTVSAHIGYAYPESAVKSFLQQAEQSGASVMYEHPVKSLEAAKADSHVTGMPTPKGLKLSSAYLQM